MDALVAALQQNCNKSTQVRAFNVFHSIEYVIKYQMIPKIKRNIWSYFLIHQPLGPRAVIMNVQFNTNIGDW